MKVFTASCKTCRVEWPGVFRNGDDHENEGMVAAIIAIHKRTFPTHEIINYPVETYADSTIWSAVAAIEQDRLNKEAAAIMEARSKESAERSRRSRELIVIDEDSIIKGKSNGRK